MTSGAITGGFPGETVTLSGKGWLRGIKREEEDGWMRTQNPAFGQQSVLRVTVT